MANNYVSNPMVITVTATAAVAVGGGTDIALDEVYWYNPTNIGDTFTLTLGDGTQVIRQGRCEVAAQSQVFAMYGRRVQAIQPLTLTSGTLYVYWH